MRSKPAAMLVALVGLTSFLAAAGGQAQPRAPFTIVETGQAFRRLDAAVAAIGDGAGTIRIAPGRYRDCAVQEGGRIAFVAERPGTAIFDAAICEDKATLVLRGRAARVEGLVFTGMRVSDGNGAGIRLERGDLAVSGATFIDGQSGILTAVDPDGAIIIDRSTFSRLGRNGQAHSIYVGDYGSVRVVNSRFERGAGGHYLKSRAARLEVLDCSFDDSAGRETNYMIDVPNGATGRIAGNFFVQGPSKENHSTLIAIAAEGAARSSAGLIIEDNDVALAPGFRRRTAFVGDWSGERLVIRNNRLRPGIALFARR